MTAIATPNYATGTCPQMVLSQPSSFHNQKTTPLGPELPSSSPGTTLRHVQNAAHTMLSYHPAPLRPNSPLFSLDGSSPITRYGFLKSVSSLLSRAGLDSSQYSGHSFRRGGAQSAYDTGLPIDDLQLIGRWKSLDVARRYFGLTLHKLQSLSSAMSSSNPSRPLRFESLGNTKIRERGSFHFGGNQ